MTDLTQERIDYDLIAHECVVEYISKPDSEQEWCHYIFCKTLGIAIWPLGDMLLSRIIINIGYRWMIVDSTLLNLYYAEELSELYNKAAEIYENHKNS